MLCFSPCQGSESKLLPFETEQADINSAAKNVMAPLTHAMPSHIPMLGDPHGGFPEGLTVVGIRKEPPDLASAQFSFTE